MEGNIVALKIAQPAIMNLCSLREDKNLGGEKQTTKLPIRERWFPLNF